MTGDASPKIPNPTSLYVELRLLSGISVIPLP
jgi:hypothetical protein